LTKRYTWRGKGQGINSNSQYIHRRLDFFLVWDELQPFVVECDIIPAPSTDHSAITLNIKYIQEHKRGPSFWKLNNSLLNDEAYIIGLKAHLKTIRQSLNIEGVISYQLRWEYIKYEIRKFSMKYSKAQAVRRRSKYDELEKEIVAIEKECNWENNKELVAQHDKLKTQLENLSNYITEGIIIRSKATWYEFGEKNNKYFLTLEKRNKAKTHIKKLLHINNEEITNEVEILKMIENYFSKLFEKKSEKTIEECDRFLEEFPVPKLSDMDKEKCEQQITAQECLDAFKQMGNSKNPRK